MKYDARLCRLVYKKQLTPTIYDFRLENKVLAELAQAGQFAHVLVPSKTLRRPISICDVEDDCLRLVFEVRGAGTDLLAQTKEGECLDVLAPLGHGFTLDPNQKTVFVGGGIGVPPMLYSVKSQGGSSVAILGFRNRAAVILEEDFKAVGGKVIVTTDDGSYGLHGFVTQPLAEEIKTAEMICACGPMPMLKRIAVLAKEYNVPCQVSLEERMACGIGACLGCAVLVNREDGTQGYKHVCKNGPVFNAEEVVWQ